MTLTLHAQLKPKLWGEPPRNLTADELREKRKNRPQWREEFFHNVTQRNSPYIDVIDEIRGTHVRLDMKVAAAYILTCPQWFNTLNQPIMLCIWVKDWESAALFRYFPDMLEWNKPGYLPKWRIFCQDRRDLPNNAIHWREPSTVWRAWHMIGFMSETDFLEKNAQHLPQEVGFRNFPPMWSFHHLWHGLDPH